MQARLRTLQGAFAGHSILMPSGGFVVGREADCHCILDDRNVSRRHCIFILDGWTLRVRDLGSRNGTFVNGNRLGRREEILMNGDRVLIGNWSVIVEIEGKFDRTDRRSANGVDATVQLGDDSTLIQDAFGQSAPSRIPASSDNSH